MAPAITFSIPYYSGRDYLGKAIESVLAQDADIWTCVVADDSSEADLPEFVAKVGRGRVRYVKNPTNLGIDGNFNQSVNLAETELVTVFHADDELMPNYASTMVRAAERHPRAAALFCRSTIIGPNSESWFSLADYVKKFLNPAQNAEFILEGEPGVRALLKANFIMAPTLLFRKSVLGERRFPMGYKFVLDWELTMGLLLDGETLVGIPDVCYRYRRHFANMTEKLAKTQQRFREESAFYDRMREKVQARGWTRCEAVASHKRMLKANITYRAVKSAVRLQLGDAAKGFRFLREL